MSPQEQDEDKAMGQEMVVTVSTLCWLKLFYMSQTAGQGGLGSFTVVVILPIACLEPHSSQCTVLAGTCTYNTYLPVLMPVSETISFIIIVYVKNHCMCLSFQCPMYCSIIALPPHPSSQSLRLGTLVRASRTVVQSHSGWYKVTAARRV